MQLEYVQFVVATANGDSVHVHNGRGKNFTAELDASQDLAFAKVEYIERALGIGYDDHVALAPGCAGRMSSQLDLVSQKGIFHVALEAIKVVLGHETDVLAIRRRVVVHYEVRENAEICAKPPYLENVEQFMRTVSLLLNGAIFSSLWFLMQFAITLEYFTVR